MGRARFKTKLTKKQTRRNIAVFLTVFVCSYAFVLLFGFSIDIFDGWTPPEIMLISLGLLFFILSMMLFPVLIASAVLGYQKGKARRVCDDATYVPVQNIAYYRESLSELNPSLVSLLVDLDIYGQKDVAATLLRLQNKKILSFQPNGRITIADYNGQPLDNSERELLAMVKKGRLGDKRSFALWRQNRFRDAEALGYIQKSTRHKEQIKPVYVILGCLSFVAAFFLWGAFLGMDLYEKIDTVSGTVMIFFYLLLVDALLCLPFYSLTKRAGYTKRGDVLWERTPLGNETAEKIAGLARFIHEFSLLSEAGREQVALWDDYLVYAIVLEENEQIVKDIGRYGKAGSRGFEKLRSRLS